MSIAKTARIMGLGFCLSLGSALFANNVDDFLKGPAMEFEKESVLRMPKELTEMTIEGSWDPAEGVSEDAMPDLDINVMFMKNGAFVDSVHFNKLDYKGKVTLDGDNRTGKGDGADETIKVNMKSMLDEDIDQMVVSICVYNKAAGSFDKIKNAEIKLNAKDSKGVTQEIGHYVLKGMNYAGTRAVLAANLQKVRGAWVVQAKGTPYEIPASTGNVHVGELKKLVVETLAAE